MSKETTETETKTVAKAAKTKSETVETVVYVGPTIPGVASHNTVFNNGLPQGVTDAIANEPAFNNLLVPVNGLAAALSDIANKRGATYAFYEKAANYKA
jgi:hypothetical protein